MASMLDILWLVWAHSQLRPDVLASVLALLPLKTLSTPPLVQVMSLLVLLQGTSSRIVSVPMYAHARAAWLASAVFGRADVLACC
jgi:hypothetical protein